jgi:apolipoprotein D and lipocalin family protein
MFLAGCYENEPLEVATDVDLERLEGRWYEIAKLPRHSQRDCVHTTVTYERRSSGEFRMLTDCQSPNEASGVAHAEAKLVVPDLTEPAKLALDFGFYQGEHWIVEVGTAHEYIVIGHPTRQYLWILSRDDSLKQQTLDAVVERARARRFPVENLEYTQQ